MYNLVLAFNLDDSLFQTDGTRNGYRAADAFDTRKLCRTDTLLLRVKEVTSSRQNSTLGQLIKPLRVL